MRIFNMWISFCTFWKSVCVKDFSISLSSMSIHFLRSLLCYSNFGSHAIYTDFWASWFKKVATQNILFMSLLHQTQLFNSYFATLKIFISLSLLSWKVMFLILRICTVIKILPHSVLLLFIVIHFFYVSIPSFKYEPHVLFVCVYLWL